MIRQGLLCSHCSDKRCVDIGSAAEPIELECKSCDGGGCDECSEGFIKLEGCPQVMCKSVVPAIGLIDLFEKGLPPVAGGTLDQSVWFLEAAKVLSYEESRAKQEATRE